MQTYCSLFLPSVVLCYYELENGKLLVKLGIVISGSLARLHLRQHRLLCHPPFLKLEQLQLLGCISHHCRRGRPQAKETPVNEFCSCSWASNSDARWPDAHTSLTHEELSLTKFVRCVLRLLTICIFWHRLAISRITVVTDYLGFSVGLVYDFFLFQSLLMWFKLCAQLQFNTLWVTADDLCCLWSVRFQDIKRLNLEQ